MGNKQIDNDLLIEAAEAILIQRNQKQAGERQVDEIYSELSNLSEINRNNINNLDALIMEAERLSMEQGIDISRLEEGECNIVNVTEDEIDLSRIKSFEKLDRVKFSKDITWEEYLINVESYAARNSIDLSKDPFEDLMTESERGEIAKRIMEDYTMKKANCDKYDYLIASFCGVATGLIDAFFVGMPGESKLGKWTDNQVDSLVEKFAQGVWLADSKNGVKAKKPDGIASAIGYLERRFGVNYDARYGADLNLGDKVLNMSARNHHLKSLGHCPDLIGLFFSILDQFTGMNSFISDGKIIRVQPKGEIYKLQGGNFFAKLFCGFCNWLGHIMSDIAGSSGTRGHLKNGRGAGVPIPFYEMFQFCNFGSFNVNGERKNLAELSVKVFESGYDARHGITIAIPVVLNEIMIRFLWAVKSRFYHKKGWIESMPFGNKPELRRMLLVGHGALCIVDGIDAGIRSGGDILSFVLHLNLVAWSRFAFVSLQEVRALYNKNALDTEALDKDLEIEWKYLYGNI